ncbi:glycosyltransferase [Lichenicoccus roseus]|uniref:Glycosyltransferase n=1 Tax=Lichenicoccus roseus TaxID=2683649 RepID=A0A5R9J7R0_9PROT|nr:glycosyltransferase [Lichenicoccus roseus]
MNVLIRLIDPEQHGGRPVNELRIEIIKAEAAVTPGYEPDLRPASWSHFDRAWYLGEYPAALEQMKAAGLADVEAFYRQYGASLGHSPNLYFDEAYYMDSNPDVAALVARGTIASGFSHYCNGGYHDRSPHWLFSESFYLSSNADISRGVLDRHGLLNGYDHYLTLGDREFRSGHWFFDPMLYRSNKPEEDRSTASAGGSFEQFLQGGCIAGTFARVSWYFDAAWYLATYPEVAACVASGAYRCALHHYLTNRRPQDYLPLEWFSETYYAATYPDVQGAVENGRFRNTYEHFIKHGAGERRRPHADIDLLHYYLSGRVQADLEGGAFRDAFAHWLSRLATGSLGRVAEPIAELQCKQLFARAAEAMLPQLARDGLDFRLAAGVAPLLSVIVVLHNQFALTMMAMASPRSNFPGPIELILVDSGSSDETRHIERHIAGAVLIRFAYNAGFVESCNSALAQVSAPALLYLNNDLLLGINACQRALDRLFSEPSIAAVGAKCIRTNGQLQEAGSIIWRDGTTYGYLRDADPNAPEANFLREADFCSGAFLMFRTALVKQLGGFDDDYRPAYYEEADLCVRLRKAGYRILYDPSVVIQHFEYGSANAAASSRLMLRNHKIFLSKHMDWLRYQHPPRLRNAVHARSPRRGTAAIATPPGSDDDTAAGSPALRILFIEDRIPLRNLGAGYVRSNDIIQSMAALGHQVSIFPIYKATASPIEIYRDMPETAEVLYERGMETLPAFIEERAGFFDIVWIGRTHNLERLLPILGDGSNFLPQHGFVLDTEAIAAPRTAEQNRVLGLPQTVSLDEALKRELQCAYFCQKIIAVSEADAALVRRAGHSNVAVLGHLKQPAATPSSWSQRSGLLFLGAIHDPNSPNHDSLEWFIEQVLPLLDSRLAPGVRFTVAGFVRRGIDLSALARHPRVDLIGAVDDLEALYDRHRVFVAPTRFAGGIPFKVHEAAAFGLPVVATRLLCDQVGWTDQADIMNGGTDDPARFADRVLRLYENSETWNTVRRGALRRLLHENSQALYLDSLRDILHDTHAGGSPAWQQGIRHS